MLRERLKQLAAEYPRYGYELLHGMLKAEGLVVNEKKTYRIYREEKLQVRRKRRKRLLARNRVAMPTPEGLINAGPWTSCPINWPRGADSAC